MEYFAYKSKFKENEFPIFVIASEDPRKEREWNDNSYTKVFIGIFENYRDAKASIESIEPDFSDYEELDDSYLQGETVFVRKS